MSTDTSLAHGNPVGDSTCSDDEDDNDTKRVPTSHKSPPVESFLLSLAYTDRQKQRLESMQSTTSSSFSVDSAFERNRHRARYASHVLDVDRNHADDYGDLSSSFGDSLHSVRSQRNLETAEWFQKRNDTVDASSESFSGENLWERPTRHGVIDQSINLMDTQADKYEHKKDPDPVSGFESFKAGLERVAERTDIFWWNYPSRPFNKSRTKRGDKGDKKATKTKGEKTTFGWPHILLIVLVALLLIAGVCLVVIRQSKSRESDNVIPPTTAQYRSKEEDKIAIESNKSGSIPSMTSLNYSMYNDTVMQENDDLESSLRNSSSIMEIQSLSTDETPLSHYEVTHQDVKLNPTVTLPATTRLRAITAMVLEYKVSSPEDILLTKQSASYRALKWICDEDPAQVALPDNYYKSHSDTDSKRETKSGHGMEEEFLIQQVLQRYVFAVFYLTMTSSFNTGDILLPNESSGASRNHDKFLESWLTEDHVCHWHGLSCGTSEKGSNKAGVESIHMATVVTVNLTQHELVGTLPRELFAPTALPDLISIDLSHNHLHGAIPVVTHTDKVGPTKIATERGEYYINFSHRNRSVSSETEWDLLHLDLSHNQLTGLIPPLLKQMKNSKTLFLNHNHFSGMLDSFVEDSHVTGSKLEQLDVGNNLLTGTIPSDLSNLKKLQLLSLESNFFSGTLPDIFDQHKDMVEININENILEGMLPETMGNMSQLARLWLDHNEFVGPIPESWMNMTELELLSLHHNTISGNIPSFWGSSMSKLADLRIDNNRFRGSIPSELGSCLTLKGLYLDENFLRGTVPSCLGNLKNLETLRVSGNRLTGEIPWAICTLTTRHQLELLSADCESGDIECGCCSNCF